MLIPMQLRGKKHRSSLTNMDYASYFYCMAFTTDITFLGELWGVKVIQ